MKIVFLGPPGAGKGTQAKWLSGRFRIPHISTGDLLREVSQNGSPIGQKVSRFMKEGKLVPDDIVTEMVGERLKREDAKKGFVLDGFPRNLSQAESLDRLLSASGSTIDLVIYLETPEETLVRRLAGRLVCQQCGANYHAVNIPPKKKGRCDLCGGLLVHREDDEEKTVRKRLSVYQSETAGLVDYYRRKNKLRVLSGDLDVLEGQEALDRLFKKEHLIHD